MAFLLDGFHLTNWQTRVGLDLTIRGAAHCQWPFLSPSAGPAA